MEKEMLDFIEKLKLVNFKNRKETFLSIIGRSKDENFISSLLSFILDPRVNGVGHAPLNKLLEAIKSDKKVEPKEKVDVTREYYIANVGRIDILIKLSNLWIVIENKIDSEEGFNQTNKYYDYISREANGVEVIYIFLKPDYHKGKPKNNYFIELKYSNLIRKFKEINYDDYNEKDRYIFLKDFITHCEENIMQELKIDESVMLYIDNINNIEKLISNYSREDDKVYALLQEEILKAFGDEWTIFPMKTFVQIYKKNWDINNEHNAVHYELLSRFDNLINRETTINYAIHIERNGQKYIDRLKESGIKHSVLFSKNYSMETQEKIIDAIHDIINNLLEISSKYTDKIDEVINTKEFQ